MRRFTRLSAPRERLFGHTVEFFDYDSFVLMFEEIFLNKQYEFETQALAPRFIDCGSNIGMALLFFKKLHPDSTVTAWRLPQSLGQDAITVETVTLDDFFPGSSLRPTLVKMDIEGAEPLGLAGMGNLIARSPDLVLITEFNPSYLDQSAARDFLERLAAYGFELTMIDDDRRQLVSGSRPQILRRLLEKGCTTNLLCTREHDPFARVLAKERTRGKGLSSLKLVRL